MPTNRQRTKYCTRCGTTKPVQQFSKNSRFPDGLQYYCKPCMSSYYTSNRERALKLMRENYQRKRDEKLAYQREYFLVNESRVRAYRKAYRIANARKLAAKTTAWREVNPEHMQAWRAANPESSRRNHAARKARELALPSERVDLQAVWERSGGQCWLCRAAVGTDAVVDHLIPLAADFLELAKWGVGHPGHVTANLELACVACNSRKSKRILPCAIARYLFNKRSKARKRHQE